MKNKVRSYITQHNMLSVGDRIVVGVSGGADSICLFHVLLELSEEYKLKLYVVHVNHGIREEEATSDEVFVEELCKKHNVNFSCVRKDVPQLAKTQGISEEEAGRNVRYEAFNDCSRKNSCDKIAVAHNKNDNAETFLFNLFRGSGIKGLTGIPPTRDSIIRPLLCIERSEIEEYLQKGLIPYVTDQTNLTDDYSRNKIRNNILTYAKDEINSEVIEHISNSGAMLREIDLFINKCVNIIFEEIVKEDNMDNKISINVVDFNKLDIVIQKELLRKVIKRLSNNLKDIESSHIQLILDLLAKQVGKEIHLPYEIVVIKGYNDIIFRKRSKDYKEDKSKNFNPVNLTVPCNIYIPELNKNITTKLKDYRKSDKFPNEVYTKWFDYDKIKNTLFLRTREEGDFVQIDSKGGTKKIKSLFINEKIPKEDRDQIPLIADGSHIIWVIGRRISEAYKIDYNTKTIIEISIYEGNTGKKR